jgi:hypothetical protein
MTRLYDAFQLVKTNLQASREEQKTQYDARAQKLKYQVGDKVLLDVRAWKRGTSRKLNPRYKGPYRVKKVNTNSTVEIQECLGKQTQLVHVNRIKPLFETMIWKDEPCVPFFDVRTQIMSDEIIDIPLPEETSDPAPLAKAPLVKPRKTKKKKLTTPSVFRPAFVVAPRPGRRPGLRSWKVLEKLNTTAVVPVDSQNENVENPAPPS